MLDDLRSHYCLYDITALLAEEHAVGCAFDEMGAGGTLVRYVIQGLVGRMGQNYVVAFVPGLSARLLAGLRAEALRFRFVVSVRGRRLGAVGGVHGGPPGQLFDLLLQGDDHRVLVRYRIVQALDRPVEMDDQTVEAHDFELELTHLFTRNAITEPAHASSVLLLVQDEPDTVHPALVVAASHLEGLDLLLQLRYLSILLRQRGQQILVPVIGTVDHRL